MSSILRRSAAVVVALLAVLGSVASAGPSSAAEADHWRKPLRVGADARINSSCATRTFCVLVANANGRAWRYHRGRLTRLPDTSLTDVRAVSCSSASFCMAIGTDGATSTWNGAGWVPRPALPSGEWGVSCVTRRYCLAVGGSDPDLKDWARWDGTQWALGDDQVAAVTSTLDCPAIDDCMVGQWDGFVYRFDGSSWSFMHNDPPPEDSDFNSVVALSCPTSRFCAATYDSSDVAVWKHGTWHKPVHLRGLGGTACASATSCTHLGGRWATRYDGHRWSRAHHAAPRRYRTSSWRIDCPTRRFCLADDFYNSVLVRRP